MGKYHTVLHEAVTRPKRSRGSAVLALTCLVLLAPILYESGLMILASWSSMTGAHIEAKTPVLNALSGWTRAAGQEARTRASWAFISSPWDPSLAVPIAIFWALAIALVFLRRDR